MQTIFELDTREAIKLVEDSRAKRKICGLCVFVLMRSTTTTPSPCTKHRSLFLTLQDD